MTKAGWKPEQLEMELKKTIIGQDDYLHDLSTCLWLHNQRYEHFLRTGEIISRPKYNMLVIGKSGMGKTSAIEAAANLLNIPMVIEDASELRGTGWKGKQVSEIVRDIYVAADKMQNVDERELQFSIVVLDEIDKVFEDKTQDRTFSPISNLLKFIEGMESAIGEGNSRLRLRTDNLLFIAVGAFDGLDEIIAKRIQPKSIGFSIGEKEKSPDENILKAVTPVDLAAYGVSQQFLGRLPIITVMNELEVSDYENILLNSDISPIHQLNHLMKQEQNTEISISPLAAEKLALKVKESALGARALQGEVVNLLKDTLYSLQEDTGHVGYCIDYEDDFLVRALPGKREPLKGRKKKFTFHLTEQERKCMKQVKLDFIWEEGDSIRTYAEDMFEPYETKDFGEYPGQGLVDLYDYMTIRQAQFYTAAAIIEMILASRYEGRAKNMMSLLNIIRLLSQRSTLDTNDPLEKWRDDFLERANIKDTADLRKIREISWEVARKHGLYLYDHSIDDFDDLEFIS